MSFGFIVNEIESDNFGLSFVESNVILAGTTFNKTFTELIGYDLKVVIVPGAFPISTVPSYPTVIITNTTVAINASSATLDVTAIILCH